MKNENLKQVWNALRKIAEKCRIVVASQPRPEGVVGIGMSPEEMARRSKEPFVIDYIGCLVPQQRKPLANPDQLIGWEVHHGC